MRSNKTFASCGLIFLLCCSFFNGCLEKSTGAGPGHGGGTSLHGVWTGFEVGGASGWAFIFSSSQSEVYSPDSTVWYKGIFTKNDDVDPKQINLDITECSVSSYVGETSLAIYKIEGDTLTWAGNEPGVGNRPTSFVPNLQTRVFKATKE